jgi:lysozyme
MLRRNVLAGVLAAGLALAVIVVGYLWFEGYQPDRARFPLRGIDVSHHQGVIDWRAVAADDVAFVYVKASEGADSRDPLFLQNWQGARHAGLPVGAYHYFTFCRSGEVQAANFLAAVPHVADALPPAVDLEYLGNCALRPDGRTFSRELEAFLMDVEQREEKPAIFYVTPEFYQAYGAYLPPRRLWARSIVREPPAALGWTLWQYHSRGHVHGVVGPVDLDVFSADRRAFSAFSTLSVLSAFESGG